MGNVVARPEVTFALASASQPVENSAQKVLLVGQITSAGSASSGSWHENLAGGSENALFGQSSQLAEMVRAFKRITDRVQVDAIALDDAGGAARVVDVPITGPATEAGTIYITVGSERFFRFSVPVANGDSAATIAASAIAVINANLQCPYTAAVAAGPDRVTLTADNAGALANQDPIEVEGSVAGVAFGTLANATAGATDPTLTTVLDVINDERYQGIVWPYANDTAPVNTLLEDRFNRANAVLDGVAFSAHSDSLADQLTLLGTTNANHKGLVILMDEEINDGANGYLGPAIAERGYIKATYTAAIRALRLTPGLAITQYVTAPDALDQFGGAALASLPYFNTPFPHLPAPKPGRGFTEAEIISLANAGGGILGVNPAGSAAIAGEIPTTYVTDPAGNPDVTFKFLNYVDTASGAREYFHNNTRARFAQSRLVEGPVVAGRSMANADVIKAFLVRLYNDLSGPDFTLVQSGSQAVKFFKDNITVTLDLAQGKATVTMKLPIVTQLRSIVATVNIAFSTEG